jgi:L-asparaginase/Glu-tRNA(Gln) amidotransferase subunit D
MEDRILLIRTGGTIDAQAYDDPKNPPKYVDTLKGDNSVLMEAVKTLPNYEKVDGYSWGRWSEYRFVKDSQLFEPDDIKELATIIKEDDRKFFIITHGTDAMVRNAEILKKELEGTDKVVAFVGAMVPLSMAEKHGGDGKDALSFAIENIQKQESGVYIVSRDKESSRVLKFHDPDKVTKSHTDSVEKSRFITTERAR